MPSKHDIKINNTASLVALIEGVGEKWDLKPSTLAGAGMSVYVNALLAQAADEGIDVARRNLDRAIELLTAMRGATHADGMAEVAANVAAGHIREIRQHDR